MASSVPSNVHVSTHPCLRAKLSILRSQSTNARETKQLVHEIATIVGCEALAHGLKVTETGTVCTYSASHIPRRFGESTTCIETDMVIVRPHRIYRHWATNTRPKPYPPQPSASSPSCAPACPWSTPSHPSSRSPSPSTT